MRVPFAIELVADAEEDVLAEFPLRIRHSSQPAVVLPQADRRQFGGIGLRELHPDLKHRSGVIVVGLQDAFLRLMHVDDGGRVQEVISRHEHRLAIWIAGVDHLRYRLDDLPGPGKNQAVSRLEILRHRCRCRARRGHPNGDENHKPERHNRTNTTVAARLSGAGKNYLFHLYLPLFCFPLPTSNGSRISARSSVEEFPSESNSTVTHRSSAMVTG